MEFISRGVNYRKIYCEGRVVPSQQVLESFYEAVDDFIRQNENNLLIGVHCTHGINRTGYLVCSYMIHRLGFDPKQAIEEFNSARGCSIERPNYISALHQRGQNIIPRQQQRQHLPAVHNRRRHRSVERGRINQSQSRNPPMHSERFRPYQPPPSSAMYGRPYEPPYQFNYNQPPPQLTFNPPHQPNFNPPHQPHFNRPRGRGWRPNRSNFRTYQYAQQQQQLPSPLYSDFVPQRDQNKRKKSSDFSNREGSSKKRHH
ncbi:hypothetical protein CHUAL_008123 [Chamberlinius hualienensis]